LEPTANTPGDEHESPQERIERAIMELNESVSAELLDLIHQASPQFFESLVLDLLHMLVNGARLTELMIEHGVGVTHKPLMIARVDSDDFEEA
jgi:restriction endonuclease Mrr